MKSLITEQRKKYHESIIRYGILSVDSKGIPSNADKSSRLSIAISSKIAETLYAELHEKQLAQTSGAKFEQVNLEFIANTFPLLQNLRPGKWVVEKLGNRNSIKTSSFVQYEHLSYLGQIIKTDSKLATALGNDYMVAPDIVIYRLPETDEEINNQSLIVDDSAARQAVIRKKYSPMPILHASISAKWTMRSDRAQKQPHGSSRSYTQQKRAPSPHRSNNRRTFARAPCLTCIRNRGYRLSLSFRTV